MLAITFAAVMLSLGAVLCIMLRFSAHMRGVIYDVLIVGLTSKWYKAVLERLPPKVLLLDVGCGTGKALAQNADILRNKDISIIGVDYDADYVQACIAELTSKNLMDRCQIQQISIYDYPSELHRSPNRALDAAYFSGSLMIMPSPIDALKHVASMLKPGGKIYCTQTFEHRKTWWISLVKPVLKLLTTIDFGNVTYQEEFYQTVKSAELEIEEDSFLLGSTPKHPRSYRLIILSKP